VPPFGGSGLGGGGGGGAKSGSAAKLPKLAPGKGKTAPPTPSAAAAAAAAAARAAFRALLRPAFSLALIAALARSAMERSSAKRFTTSSSTSGCSGAPSACG